jgi:NTP pyrophosphatase (non-canonical NTP hydrolase)
MNPYQKELDQWFREHNWPYWTPHEILARLFEEGGELARLINHIYGPKKKKTDEAAQDLELEIGDILYTLICLANVTGIDLDQAIRKSLDKVAARDKNRYS